MGAPPQEGQAVSLSCALWAAVTVWDCHVSPGACVCARLHLGIPAVASSLGSQGSLIYCELSNTLKIF